LSGAVPEKTWLAATQRWRTAAGAAGGLALLGAGRESRGRRGEERRAREEEGGGESGGAAGLGFCARVLPPLPVAISAREISGVQIGFCTDGTGGTRTTSWELVVVGCSAVRAR